MSLQLITVGLNVAIAVCNAVFVASCNLHAKTWESLRVRLGYVVSYYIVQGCW